MDTCENPRVFSGDYFWRAKDNLPHSAFAVHNLLTLSEEEVFPDTTSTSNYWLAPDLKRAEFTLDLCRDQTVHTISLVNTHNGRKRDRASQEFKVHLKSSFGPWVEVLHKILPDTSYVSDPLPIMDFSIHPTEGRYVKFQLLTFHGYGGGLQYFAAKSGTIKCINGFTRMICYIILGIRRTPVVLP